MSRWFSGVALLLVGCASLPAKPSPPLQVRVQPDPSSILRLVSARGIASGCPISAEHFLTARHNVTQVLPSGQVTTVPVVWSDWEGTTGSAWVEDYDLRRDLALMHSETSMPGAYVVAQEAPARGEAVTIAGYGKRFTQMTIRTHVLAVVSAHLVLADSGVPGFSGSCVLNAYDEVVGIFTWSVQSHETWHGFAVGVWGDWADVGWLPRRPGLLAQHTQVVSNLLASLPIPVQQ